MSLSIRPQNPIVKQILNRHPPPPSPDSPYKPHITRRQLPWLYEKARSSTPIRATTTAGRARAGSPTRSADAGLSAGRPPGPGEPPGPGSPPGEPPGPGSPPGELPGPGSPPGARRGQPIRRAFRRASRRGRGLPPASRRGRGLPGLSAGRAAGAGVSPGRAAGAGLPAGPGSPASTSPARPSSSRAELLADYHANLAPALTIELAVACHYGEGGMGRTGQYRVIGIRRPASSFGGVLDR